MELIIKDSTRSMITEFVTKALCCKTSKEVSELTGISHAHLSRAQKGIGETVSLQTLVTLAEYSFKSPSVYDLTTLLVQYFAAMHKELDELEEAAIKYVMAVD